MLCINSINISQRFLLIDFKFFGGSIIHWIRGEYKNEGINNRNNYCFNSRSSAI